MTQRSGGSEAEAHRRLALARDAMREQGHDLLVVAEDTSAILAGNVRYLSGIVVPGAAPSGRFAAVVVPMEGEPTLVVPGGWYGATVRLAEAGAVTGRVRGHVDYDEPYDPRLQDGVVA